MDRKTMQYVLGFLGILLVFYSIAYTPPTLHYLSALEDWNYMREFSLHVDGKPHVYVVPLPSDANFWAHVKPDCSDVRVTVGAGASERLLDSVVLDCNSEENVGGVAFFYDGSNTRFRLYYGNQNAVTPPSDINTDYLAGYIYKAPPFSEDDYIVRYCDDGWHGNFRFVGSSSIYLVKWDDECGSMVLGHPIPEKSMVSMRLRGNGWGDATVDIFFSTDNNVEPDYEPDTALQLRVVDDGKIHVVLLNSGEVVNEDVVCRNRWFWLSFYPDGDRFRVYSGDSYLGTLPGGRYLVFVVEKGDSRIELKDLQVKYPVKHVSVSYSPELMAPKSPRIVDLSLGDGEYYNDGDLTLSFRLLDPNNDVNVLRVYLDGNLLDEVNSPITPYTYTKNLDLNDGTYTVKIYAVDSESASTVQTLTFTVDTKPPILDINNVELNGDELNFHISAYDPNLLGCHYFFNSEENVYDIPCEGNVSIEWSGCGTVHVYAEDRAHNITSVGIDKPCPELSGGSSGGGTPCNCTVRVEFSGKTSPEANAPEVIKQSVQPATPTFVGGLGVWSILIILILLGMMLGSGL